ncbi:MFS transporter [Rheinheimera maricola]|uniref:MFS transporter n=1 Tax=Rheinheimera maricola TaxID=2793282 RepID=A0ABS7XCD6_9GAMM|nr:MFS transporter [Rheinheimera maricola]MBZ9613223.1 MFS transporter [Rheinheimera maricola]
MSSRSQSAFYIMLGGSLVLTIALGIRHGFGLFLSPMSDEFGWGRETFALAIALQNLIWGLTQPLTGALADRIGAKKVVLAGGLFYAAGLATMAMASSGVTLALSAGVLIGLALSGTSFTIILGAIGRAVPVEKRSMAMGIASAAGSFGQFIMLPGTLLLITQLGWAAALTALGVMALLIAPLAFMLKTPLSDSTGGPEQSLEQALRQAMAHKGFWLLSLGFFVCGFQVVFIGIHLPAYLVDMQLAPLVGTTVLALIGLFNIFGTYTAGWLGGRMSKPLLLSALYGIRAVVIMAFILLPLTNWTAYIFGMAMGLLWLSTVPLTNGTVASIFGVRYLSMLGGIVFLFHQLGAFLGGWFGGYVYDKTGNYDLVWYIAIGLSVLAAVLNLPVKEQAALARPVTA